MEIAELLCQKNRKLFLEKGPSEVLFENKTQISNDSTLVLRFLLYGVINDGSGIAPVCTYTSVLALLLYSKHCLYKPCVSIPSSRGIIQSKHRNTLTYSIHFLQAFPMISKKRMRYFELFSDDLFPFHSFPALSSQLCNCKLRFERKGPGGGSRGRLKLASLCLPCRVSFQPHNRTTTFTHQPVTYAPCFLQTSSASRRHSYPRARSRVSSSLLRPVPFIHAAITNIILNFSVRIPRVSSIFLSHVAIEISTPSSPHLSPPTARASTSPTFSAACDAGTVFAQHRRCL